MINKADVRYLLNKGHYIHSKIFINYFQKILIKSGPIMSASYSLFFIVLLFSIIGYYLDKTFHSFPIIFLFFFFRVAGRIVSII